MPRARPTAAVLSEELADADLGDVRLGRRLGRLADRLQFALENESLKVALGKRW